MPTSERGTGIKTTGADTYVATFKASQDVGGQERMVQIISLTSGKITDQVSTPTRSSVSVDDSMDTTTLSGMLQVGDDSYFACYTQHSEQTGQCLITPLLCDNYGNVVGVLNSKKAQVRLPVTVSGGAYLANCVSWPVLETGAWQIFPHVTDLSDSNSVDMWCFTF